MQFNKRPLTIPEQIQLLKNRGMVFEDEGSAERYLAGISYYRLSAYWYTFLTNPKQNHVFQPGTRFQQAIETYVFDRKLRLLIFAEIERIEIALRTQIISCFCHEFGNNWYEDKKLFRNPNYYHKFQTLILDEMNRTSEVFISHYRAKYTDPPNPPAWMILELASFGQMSLLYKNLKNTSARKLVAKHFGVHENVLESWLECLSYVRNTCAHHMRLWNRKLPKPPIWPHHTQDTWVKQKPDAQYQNRLYSALCIIRYLLARIIPNTSFSARLQDLLNEYPRIPRHYMGFTGNWEDEPLWKK